MRVAVEILGSSREPRRQVQHEQILAMLLRPGTIELGLRHSEMARFNYGTGEMILARRHLEEWVRVGDAHLLTLALSDAALLAACNGNNNDVELRGTAPS